MNQMQDSNPAKSFEPYIIRNDPWFRGYWMPRKTIFESEQNWVVESDSICLKGPGNHPWYPENTTKSDDF